MMVVTDFTVEQLVTLFVSVLAPLLVGLVTKASTSSRVKALLLALISAIVGVAQGFLAAPPGVTWDWRVAVVNAVVSFIISVSAHFGLWKPTGATEVAQRSLIKDDVTLAA